MAADTDHQAGTTEKKQRDERAPLSEAVGAVGGQINLGLLAGNARCNESSRDSAERKAQMLMTECIEDRWAARGLSDDRQ